MSTLDSSPKRVIKSQKLGLKRIHTLLNRPKVKIVYGVEKTLWSDEDRLNAVNHFVTLGNMTQVSEVTGIPLNTLRDWRKFAPWWKDLENTLREESNTTRAAELTSLTDKVLDSIHDRVKNGDYVYNPRTGEISRVPVTAASLNKIASTMLDKKLVLTKQPTKYTQTTDSKTELENKLNQLASAFKSFALKQPEVVDAEVITDGMEHKRET